MRDLGINDLNCKGDSGFYARSVQHRPHTLHARAAVGRSCPRHHFFCLVYGVGLGTAIIANSAEIENLSTLHLYLLCNSTWSIWSRHFSFAL